MFRWQCTSLMAMAAVAASALHAEPPARSASSSLDAPQHLFVYYPQSDLYYAPPRGRWFWREAGRWQDGPELPVRYADALDRGVQLRLDTAHPRLRHEVVRRHYAGAP